MSYKYTAKVTTTSQEEIFQRVRDFICKRNGTYDYSTTGIGWILHDEEYAIDEDTLTSGDWVVFYSAGEGGSDDLYFKFAYQGSDSAAHMTGYLYWNNSTSEGTTVYGGLTTDFWYRHASATDYYFYLYGDLDLFSIVIENDQVANNSYGGFIGRTVDGPYNQEILTLAAAYSAGSNVAITLPSTPPYGYEQWQNIYIRDHEHIEIIQIEAISSNVITVDLVNSYSAGAKIQADICYLAPASTTWAHGTSLFCYSLISRVGVVGATSNGLLRLSNPTQHAEDELQSLAANQGWDLVLGHDTNNFRGVGGRVSNVYNVTYYTGMVHDTLYSVAGVNYRYLYAGIGMLFKEA